MLRIQLSIGRECIHDLVVERQDPFVDSDDTYTYLVSIIDHLTDETIWTPKSYKHIDVGILTHQHSQGVEALAIKALKLYRMKNA